MDANQPPDPGPRDSDQPSSAQPSSAQLSTDQPSSSQHERAGALYGSAAARGEAADRAVPQAADWVVPQAAGPVRALVRLPGSKSMTNRALILAALSATPTLITGPLVARDTALMVAALRALGCQIEDDDTQDATAAGRQTSWRVVPGQPGSVHPVAQVDVGNAGTVLRFVPPVAALTSAEVTFVGDSRVSSRPVGPLLAALRQLGAQIDDDGADAIPFLVRGRGALPGGAATLDASASSQLISGLLLAAPRFTGGAQISHHGPPVPSAPHIEMTVRMLRACGAQVLTGAEAMAQADAQAGAGAGSLVAAGSGDGAGTGGERAVTHIWRVLPGPMSADRIDIEPDLSNATPFLAAALATGGQVTVADWPASSLQPASQILGLLTAMGADVAHTPAGLQVTGSGQIRGVTADLSEVGELTPVLTALAALASSPSELRGIGHLRRHESDRLAALAGEIGKLGGDVTELADGLRIIPRPLRTDGMVFDSHDDHRLVMAAAVLGLVTGGLRVRNAATAGKTFPGFTGFWTQSLTPG